ncbi:MAG: hypothetical protein IID14_05750 [Candidatus Marinimicrobia bacterium]|nr:hypothetical protein [Candidatus Neomarinimicrobiota bacterium]
MTPHSDELKRTICEQLGEDLDAELCEEVARHLADCPDCRAQFDSVTQTVTLYRRTHPNPNHLPHAVEERLYKVLSITPAKN